MDSIPQVIGSDPGVRELRHPITDHGPHRLEESPTQTMFNGHTVAVVIPAYNEESHIAGVIHSVPEFVDRVYVIDDGSTDATWQQVNAAAKRENSRGPPGSNQSFARRVLPIRHDENAGAGGAIITGYRKALSDDIDIIAAMDGDGQMDPADLHRIVEPVAETEAVYAKGTRLRNSSDRRDMTRWRLFGNLLLTQLTRIASGYWEMSDPQNGFTAISREALLDLPLDRLYRGYGFLNHVLIQLNINRQPIVDVAHRSRYGDEVSGIRYRTFVPGLSALLAVGFLERLTRCFLLRRLHPLVGSYVAGSVVLVIGLIGLVVAFVEALPVYGIMSAVGVATLGVFLLLFGSWCDVMENAELVHTVDPRVPAAPRTPEVEQQPVAHLNAAVGDGGTVGEGPGDFSTTSDSLASRD